MNARVPATNIYKEHPYFFDDKDIQYPESDGQPMAETDTHRDLIIQLIKTLEVFFAERADVYVTGNIMVYYEEGYVDEVFSPDVMVCFGVPKGDRRTYRVWEENDVVPAVIFEIASRKTWSNDRVEKRELYRQLGVQEYFLFNPEYPKRSPSFLAYRLMDNQMQPIEIEAGRARSEVLGLEVVDTGNTLRLYNPQTNGFLPTVEELANENARLRQELERLRKQLNNG